MKQNKKYNFISCDKKSKIVISTALCFSMLLSSCNLNNHNSKFITSDNSNDSEIIVPNYLLSEYPSITDYDNNIASMLPRFNNLNFEWNQGNYLELSQYLASYSNDKSAIYLASGFGYDSTYFREGLTSYFNNNLSEVYGYQDELIYVDDLNYINTNFSYGVVNTAVVNSWINTYSSTTSTKILRSVLSSLNLRPYIDEIPSAYMQSVFIDYYNMDEDELFNLIVEYNETGNITLHDRLLTFYTLFSYNQQIHSLVGNSTTNSLTGEEHIIRLCRNKNGGLMINLDPSDQIYQAIIRRFARIGEPLNTTTYIDPLTGSLIDVINPDTVESYRTAYQSSIDGMLSYAKVPTNPLESIMYDSDNILNIRGL